MTAVCAERFSFVILAGNYADTRGIALSVRAIVPHRGEAPSTASSFLRSQPRFVLRQSRLPRGRSSTGYPVPRGAQGCLLLPATVPAACSLFRIATDGAAALLIISEFFQIPFTVYNFTDIISGAYCLPFISGRLPRMSRFSPC